MADHSAPRNEHVVQGGTSDPGLLATRRRLLRGGLGIAPVLMVSAPRSVIAGTTSCQTGSAFALSSLSPSGAAKLTAYCSGHTAELWATRPLTYWPSTCLFNSQRTLNFDDVFGSSYGFDKMSLRDVLVAPNLSAKNALARQIVAAFLNARKGLTPVTVLSESTVRQIWSLCSAGGCYEPTAGVRWYIDRSVPATSGGVVAWLQSTMSA